MLAVPPSFPSVCHARVASNLVIRFASPRQDVGEIREVGEARERLDRAAAPG